MTAPVDHTLTHSPVQEYLDSLYERFLPLREGNVADYIPELALADPDAFGIALVTVDGHVYQAGDTRQPFTIQSISKALVYGLALEDNGVEAIAAKIGVEPSGDAFNSISLEDGSGRPLNPMINAGAIATTGLVHGTDGLDKVKRILDCFGRYVGHELDVNESVYASERDTGHRNRAIAHMLRNFDILSGDPQSALDVYFKQCAINVSCRDLAVAAATLANRGVNPITGVVALKRDFVGKVLSVMSTCGMYDYAGSWIYEVGLPAKSGVGGGIMAVLPGQLGLGVFSPPLDARGNSVRGIRVCKEISRDFDLHIFNTMRSAPAVIRAQYDGAQVRSKRIRSRDENEILNTKGTCIRIYELRGELSFGTTEIVAHDITQTMSDIAYLILDLRRVFSIDAAAGILLVRLCEKFAAGGKRVLLTHTDNKFELQRSLRRSLPREVAELATRFADRDLGLEWCEDQILAPHSTTPATAAKLSQNDIVIGFPPADLARLESLVGKRHYKAGEKIVSAGDPANDVFFIIRGVVSISLPVHRKDSTRLATMSAGMAFGESALIGDPRRTADVSAKTDVECYALPVDALNHTADPDLTRVRIRLIENLARGLTDKLRSANQEIRSLSQ